MNGDGSTMIDGPNPRERFEQFAMRNQDSDAENK